MKVSNIYVVVADISGYTEFSKAHSLNQLHAEKIVSDLLEVLIAHLGAPLQTNKLLGDAVLAFAVADNPDTGAEIGARIPALMDAFLEKRDELVFCNVCVCHACRAMGDLRLKVFVHRTDAVIRDVGGFEEIGGEGVVLLHRLMKNTLDQKEYALITEDAAASMTTPEGFQSFEHTEQVDILGEVKARVWTRGQDVVPPQPDKTWLQAKMGGARRAWDLDVYYLRRKFLKMSKPSPLRSEGT